MNKFHKNIFNLGFYRFDVTSNNAITLLLIEAYVKFPTKSV